MLPPTPPNLDASTGLFLALLSTLNQQQPLRSPPPSYPSPPLPTNGASKFQLTTTNNNDPDYDEDCIPHSPPIQIHINATTTIQGNNNRLLLPSPQTTQENLAKLVTLAVKDVIPPSPLSSLSSASYETGIEEGEVREREQMIEVTLDAGTKIEGSGNLVIYRKGSVVDGGVEKGKGEQEEVEEKGRKRRAGSEPIDVLRAAHAKKLKT